jgi:DNA-directed RNA polymerase specialized sigma24 family protein
MAGPRPHTIKGLANVGSDPRGHGHSARLQVQVGDETGFAQLTGLVAVRHHRIAFSILRDRERALEATQQGLIDIWRKLPTLRDPARFEACSYRIIVNACSAAVPGASVRRSR